MLPTPAAPFGLPRTLVTDLRLCASGVSVTVRGDVDLHTAPVLRDRLAEVLREGEERVVVLLDDVSFIDSTGLGVLVGASRAQHARGGTLELVCTQPRLLRILRLTGLDRVLNVHDGAAP